MRRGGSVAPCNKFIGDKTLLKSPKQADGEVERAAEAGVAQRRNFEWPLKSSAA